MFGADGEIFDYQSTDRDVNEKLLDSNLSSNTKLLRCVVLSVNLICFLIFSLQVSLLLAVS